MKTFALLLAVFAALFSFASASYVVSPSSDGCCGTASGQTCQGSTFGNCCSPWGRCGSTAAHCGTGCQSKWGACSVESKNYYRTKVSTNGQCGKAVGMTCQGSPFGNCCSPDGRCGSTTLHCGYQCQKSFGACASSSSGSVVYVQGSPEQVQAAQQQQQKPASSFASSVPSTVSATVQSYYATRTATFAPPKFTGAAASIDRPLALAGAVGVVAYLL